MIIRDPGELIPMGTHVQRPASEADPEMLLCTYMAAAVWAVCTVVSRYVGIIYQEV